MLAKEILKKYVKYDEPHRIVSNTAIKGNAWQTMYQFPNGCKVSVVSGDVFYTDEYHPYELMVVENQSEEDVDPYGYLDEFQLLAKLVEIMGREGNDGL